MDKDTKLSVVFYEDGKEVHKELTIEEFCESGGYPYIETTQEGFDETIERCKAYTQEEKSNYGTGKNSNYKVYMQDIKEIQAEPTLAEKWDYLFNSDVFQDAIGHSMYIVNGKAYYERFY